MSTFVELYLAGKVELEDIDRFIEVWHSNRYEERPLHEFLGMTWEEYAQWLENPNVFRVLRVVTSNRKIVQRKLVSR